MLIAVCDDCIEDRQKIKGLIADYGTQHKESIKVQEFVSGAELCRDIERLGTFGIIFIDINMKQEDGLQITKKIRDIYPQMPIVIVTESMSYALEGYKVKASRFLVKKTLEAMLPECLDELLTEFALKSQRKTFSFVEGTIELEIQRIIYIETDRHKNIFHTIGGEYGLYKKLGEIESELSGFGFVRIHQSFLVNMKYIEKISSYTMTLTTGTELSVPKSRYQQVKKTYAAYQGA